MPTLTTKQIVKVVALAIAGVTALTLVVAHPVQIAIVLVAGGVYALIDTGKVNV